MANSMVIWTSNTPYTAQTPDQVVVFLNFDGNLIMQDTQNKYVWQTYTSSSNNNTIAYQLKIQNDGSLVILDNMNMSIWSSISIVACLKLKLNA